LFLLHRQQPQIIPEIHSVVSHGDHRIAMSFAMAGLRATSTIEIQDCENVNTSFPGFAALTQKLGLNISTQEG
jgi:3-phosphoshikimate 1-carboxyvinyltransferase